MSWKLVDDSGLVASLASTPRVSVSILRMNPAFSPLDMAIASERLKLFGRLPTAAEFETVMSEEFGGQWPHELHFSIYATQPAVVVVFDAIAKETFGVYVWTAGGGAIADAHDRRVQVLEDLIGDAVLGESPAG